MLELQRPIDCLRRLAIEPFRNNVLPGPTRERVAIRLHRNLRGPSFAIGMAGLATNKLDRGRRLGHPMDCYAPDGRMNPRGSGMDSLFLEAGRSASR